MSEGNTFIVSWNKDGIDGVMNISEYEKEMVWSILSGDSDHPKLNVIISHLARRAHKDINSQYEIYTIQVKVGISEKDILRMFTIDPKGAVDLIRKYGKEVYSYCGKTTEEKVV